MKALKENITILFLLILLTGCLSMTSGCSKKNDENNAANYGKQAVTNVYKPIFIDLQELAGTKTNINSVTYSKDRIYFYTSVYDDGQYFKYELMSIDLNGKDLQRHRMPELTENGKYIAGLKILADGTRCMFTDMLSKDDVTGEYSQSFSYMFVNEAGDVINEVKLDKIINSMLGEEVYSYLEGITVDTDKNIYLTAGGMLCVTDFKGNELFRERVGYSDDSGYFEKLVENGFGGVAVFYSKYDAMGSRTYYKTVDLKAKKLGREKVAPERVGDNASALFCDNMGSCYISDSTGVFLTEPDTGASTEILNWVNSDISERVYNMQAASRDCFIAMTNDYTNDDKEQLVILKRVPEDEIIPKTIIELATLGTSSELTNAVVSFNRTSSEYRVSINDYARFNTEEDTSLGYATLNKDLLGGRVPDILTASYGMNIDNYISKGLLMDINKLMEADSEFKREEYLTNVFEAYEINGCLYELTPYIIPFTLAGKTKHLNGMTEWNMEEFFEYAKEVPQEVELFYGSSRGNVLSMFLSYCYDDFIDSGTGKCKFNGEAFKSLLSFTNRLKTSYEWDSRDRVLREEYSTYIREDKAILETIYLYGFSSYVEAVNRTFFDEITMIGFPNADRATGGIRDNIKFVVSSKTQCVDGVWEFFKYCLSDVYQERAKRCFPIKLSALEKMADRELNDTQDKSGVTMVIIGAAGTAINPGTRVLMQSDVDAVMNLLKSVKHISRYSPKVNAIVMEEAAPYFDGKKDLESVTNIIQSRVQILINEGR